MFNTLSMLGLALNNENITWGIGASILLHSVGLVTQPNDIDLLIDLKDIAKADKVLKSLGEKKPWEKSSTYSTQYFYEYRINNIEIDVMAGFRINHSHGVYEYIFDEASIAFFKNINGVEIPFTALEDWYILYQLIPNRDSKVQLIENQLRLNGIQNNVLLDRALKGNLPSEVKDRVQSLSS